MAPMDVKEAPKPRRGEAEALAAAPRRRRDLIATAIASTMCAKVGTNSRSTATSTGTAKHGGCHRKRLRRAAHFSFASVVMLTLVLFMAFKCRLDLALFGSPEGVHMSGSGLEKRQSTGSTGSSSNGSTQGSFVKNKREFCMFFACEDTRI